MDLNLHKNTGDKLAASEINQITEAVNSKLDITEFKTINGETITGNGEINIETNVDLSGYLTTTGATNAFQPKGNYLIESDVIGRYIPTGTTFSYLDLSNKPSIPSITGLASESFVLNSLTGKSNISDVYTKVQIDAKAFLTGVTWSQITSKPTLFSGSYSDLTSKPDLTVKADLVSGKVPTTQLPDANLNSAQFETLQDGTIGIKTSYLMSLGLGGVQLAAPASFAISGTTSTSLSLTWSGVANANSYTLERANTAAFTGSTIVYSGATLAFNNTGLTSSTNYYYRVKATALNYIASNYSTVSGATTAAQIGVNYMTGFVPVMVLSGLTSGISSTTTTGSTVYVQDSTTEFNSTQNFHIPAANGGEIAVKIVDLTSNVSFGLTDNFELSNPYGCRINGNKIYQKNGQQETEIVGQTVAVGDFVIVKTYDDNTGGDNNALRYYKIFKSSDGGETRTALTLPEGSAYNNSTTKFICFTNSNPSRLAYPQMKGQVAG